mgnify:CR=1 FL=1
MAKVQNTFIKSKMNKDLDARLLPQGEYREAVNAQISKSQGSQVGNLENSLGNAAIQNYQTLTQSYNIKCIGSFADEINSTVYLFFTDYNDGNPNKYVYSPSAKNFIISTNILSNESYILVQGAFLNFSQNSLITGVNILEELLFFTDNRNQPRVINTSLAQPETGQAPTYYQTEDQISVAKYNPFKCMEMWQESILGATDPVPYETTMKDVSTLFLPNGGSCLASATATATNVIQIDNTQGEINESTTSAYGANGASTISIQNNLPGQLPQNALVPQGVTVTSVTDNGDGTFELTLSGNISILENQKIVFNQNPYFDPKFSGDPDYLQSIFARFSYRFKFVDNEYSIFAPFTQIAFIPKQDGYFMLVDPTNPSNTGSQQKDDQAESYRSTVVFFVENKVNSIDLRIPLPFTNYTIQAGLKLKEIDILYKESDGIAVKVVETIPIGKITEQSGIALTSGAQTPGGSGTVGDPTTIAIDNIQGGITIGDPIVGVGIDDGTTIVSFTPTDPSSPSAGSINVSKAVAQLDDNVLLTIGSPNYFVYKYRSTKPTKTLPSADLIRVYDKTPLRAQAQEVAGNRVIYGNFQNKLDPPAFLDYNVAATEKSPFTVAQITAAYTGAGATIPAFTNITINVSKAAENWFAGYTISSNTYGCNIPPGTLVSSTDNNTTGTAIIQLTNAVTLPAGGNVVLILEPGADTENSTSKIEYPSSSVKTNRNYQIGFVLSDRYGRQSSVILSNNETSIVVNGVEYAGSTLYSPYIDETNNQTSWPGNSLKILMNRPINAELYNSDVSSLDYNPLGWYSYKIVVKQTEQEYYNVYLPGIMASYPGDTTLEVGQTSHAVLINDNINKIPRDLTEVGPEQKQFRSSVQLFGRVENTSTQITTNNEGASNTQYYPGRQTNTVSVISTVNDLFEYDPIDPPEPNLFPQFYSLESNPLIARISTINQIGQLASVNYAPSSGEPKTFGFLQSGTFVNVSNNPGQSALINHLVVGQGVPEGIYVNSNTLINAQGEMTISFKDVNGNVSINLIENETYRFIPTGGPGVVPAFKLTQPGIQYLAVYETEPTTSAIDIFWETSTSGLISDLNNAILNNQSQPAGSNITWDPDQFDEGLAEDGSILSGNGFVITDTFGQTITINPTGADPDTVTIEGVDFAPGVVNANGDSVSGAGFVSTTQVRDYFILDDTSATGVGPWQIKTTSQANPGASSTGQNYFDNIFFFYNNNAALREFTFTFKIRIGGQDNFVIKQANLANVPPEYYLIRALNNVPTITPVEYGPGSSPVLPIPTFVPVKTKKDELSIAFIYGNNGSANKDETITGGALSTRDLAYIGQTLDLASGPQIFDQRIGSVGGPLAKIDGEDIFGLIILDTQSQDGNIGVALQNKFWNQSESMPAGIFYVTIALQDAGGTPTYQQFEIDMRVTLNQDNFWNKTQEGRAIPTDNPFWGSNSQYYFNNQGDEVCGANCLRSDMNPLQAVWHHYPATIFRITASDTGATSDQIGWYLFGAGFFDNTVADAGNCCPRYISPSLPMTQYSLNDQVSTANTITIPFNTAIGGNVFQHKVQKQPTDITGPMPITAAQIPTWAFPPYIRGRVSVTSYNSSTYMWGYTVLEGGDDAMQNCMKFFRDVNGTTTTAGTGWTINTQSEGITGLGGDGNQRVGRIKFINEDNNGDKFFYYNPNDSEGLGNFLATLSRDSNGLSSLVESWDFQTQGPQIIYTYACAMNIDLSPWYFSKGDTLEALQKVWAMWSYDPWTAMTNSDGRPSWLRFATRFSATLYPPVPNDNSALTEGIAEYVNNNGGDTTCPDGTKIAFENQAEKPSNVNDYRFSII